MTMATSRIDACLALTAEDERRRRSINDDDVEPNDVDDLSFLSPTPVNDVDENDEYDDGFLRLTAMVRAVYLAYLRECLLTNYITCHEGKGDGTQSVQVSKCAGRMELNAVRLALETGLYRRNMLRMIADVKSHTLQKKPYDKLMRFLKWQTPDNKVDVAVQTDDIAWGDSHANGTDTRVKQPAQTQTQLSDDSYENGEENAMEIEADREIDLRETKRELDSEINDSQLMDDVAKNDDDDSRDSLMRHMEDMFCESDDSCDLTRLIEKHSGVTKASIDREIDEMRREAADANATLINHSGANSFSRTNSTARSLPPVPSGNARGRITFSRYKEMQSKLAKSETTREINGNETLEDKRKRRMNAVWFVERVHQVSKLRVKMTELSLTNYRKHGRLKGKFLRLFGDSEEEEMMPESPICIEEHLPACKERIAPWIVRCLMPFYKKRRIKDRQLFKAVAKYIADMLIVENTFPERECVSEYIENYFRNKKCIKTKQDVYL